MKAVTVQPGVAGSARYEEVPEPDERSGSILVEAVAVGICGTDVEIASGAYGWAPPGRERLVLGHESLGRVVDRAAAGCKPGDLVVGIVRRPDPVPCPNCAVGEWDMCRNGQYTERGIKQIDGFMSERWRIEPGYYTKVDPSLGLLGVLLEPTTVVAKAWEQVAAMRARAFWQPRRVLVTGAGPIGLLAALIGVQHGLEVHVLDRVTEGAKPQLVRDLGATYHAGPIARGGLRAGRHHRVHRRGAGDRRLDPPGRRRRRVVPHRGRQRRPDQRTAGGRHGHRDGVAEQRDRRLGQRQPPALLPRGRGPRGGRPGVAGPADLAPGAAGGHRRGAAARPGRHQGRRGVRRLTMTDGGLGARDSPWPARPSRTCSARGPAGTRVAASCCGSTSRPGGSTATGSPTTARCSPYATTELPGTVGAIAPIEGDDGWLLAADRGFTHLAPDGAHRVIAEVSPAGTRMNDAACDPQGRFWAGALADDHHAGGGALYRLDGSGRTEQVLDGLTIPNGVGWSLDGATMYLVDSGPRVIHAFAFDAGTGGDLRRTDPGHRARGRRLAGRVDGGRRRRPLGGGLRRRPGPALLARGRDLKAFAVPAEQTTCCAFAGRGLNRLYVTTATEGWTDDRRRAEPGAGLVYRIDTDATGQPAAPFRPDPDGGRRSSVDRPSSPASARRRCPS